MTNIQILKAILGKKKRYRTMSSNHSMMLICTLFTFLGHCVHYRQWVLVSVTRRAVYLCHRKADNRTIFYS